MDIAAERYRLLSACAAVLGFVSFVALRGAELGQPAATLNITACACPARVATPAFAPLQAKFGDYPRPAPPNAQLRADVHNFLHPLLDAGDGPG